LKKNFHLMPVHMWCIKSTWRVIRASSSSSIFHEHSRTFSGVLIENFKYRVGRREIEHKNLLILLFLDFLHLSFRKLCRLMGWNLNIYVLNIHKLQLNVDFSFFLFLQHLLPIITVSPALPRLLLLLMLFVLKKMYMYLYGAMETWKILKRYYHIFLFFISIYTNKKMWTYIRNVVKGKGTASDEIPPTGNSLSYSAYPVFHPLNNPQLKRKIAAAA
jgi:hypothetical protein